MGGPRTDGVQRSKREQARLRAAARKRRETLRLKKLLSMERELWERGLEHIAGVDEAGRGPLAGPVVAAAVILPPGFAVRGVDDSKRLTAERRETLAVEIRAHALSLGVGAASCREVDRLNILRASHLAMARAVSRLTLAPQHIIVDGLPVPTLGEHTAVVDGDALVHAVACASVVAKVVRDRLMHRLAPRYPTYGWCTNVGYATSEHLEALASHGPTPHHRRSFVPVQLSLDLNA